MRLPKVIREVIEGDVNVPVLLTIRSSEGAFICFMDTPFGKRITTGVGGAVDIIEARGTGNIQVVYNGVMLTGIGKEVLLKIMKETLAE